MIQEIEQYRLMIKAVILSIRRNRANKKFSLIDKDRETIRGLWRNYRMEMNWHYGVK
jgi:hypothetical protein